MLKDFNIDIPVVWTPNKKKKKVHIVKEPSDSLSFPKISSEEIRELTDQTNPKCVFHESRFVGNDEAAERGCDLLFSSLENENREFGLGPVFLDAAPSSGKTHFAKLLAEGSGLPLVELDRNIAKNTDDIAKRIEAVCAEYRYPLADLGTRNGFPYYGIPPIVCFWDEFHGISEGLLTGILRAMESKDAILTTKKGMFDCSKVLWIVATTHIGVIYEKNPALLTRFMIIKLNAPSPEEVAKIVQIQSGCKNWPLEDCRELVKHFGLVVREVISAAKQTNIKVRRLNCSRKEAIAKLAFEKGVNKGMGKDELRLLQFLAHQYPNRITYADMSSATHMPYETLRGMILPALAKSRPGLPAMISRKNFRITLDGAKALKERNCIDNALYTKIVEGESKCQK